MFDFLKTYKLKKKNMAFDEIMAKAEKRKEEVNVLRIEKGLAPFETVDEMIFGVKHLEIKMKDLSPEERNDLLAIYGKDTHKNKINISR